MKGIDPAVLDNNHLEGREGRGLQARQTRYNVARPTVRHDYDDDVVSLLAFG
jgi:hypothetical protein